MTTREVVTLWAAALMCSVGVLLIVAAGPAHVATLVFSVLR